MAGLLYKYYELLRVCKLETIHQSEIWHREYAFELNNVPGEGMAARDSWVLV